MVQVGLAAWVGPSDRIYQGQPERIWASSSIGPQRTPLVAHRGLESGMQGRHSSGLWKCLVWGWNPFPQGSEVG